MGKGLKLNKNNKKGQKNLQKAQQKVRKVKARKQEKLLSSSLNPVLQKQQLSTVNKKLLLQEKFDKKKKVIKKITNKRLEDVDDISAADYKKSEENTLKRVRDHVYDDGDDLDNYDILGSDDELPQENIFTFDASDIGSTDFMNDEQVAKFKNHLKKNKMTKEFAALDRNSHNKNYEPRDEDDEEETINKTKLSKREKEKLKLEKKLVEAKMVAFKKMDPIKKRYWKDTQKNITQEELRDQRIKIKAKVETSYQGQEVPRPILSFDDPDLPKSMKKFIDFLCNKYSSFTQPTPVQSQCWSGILSGQDILSIAQTGSGKTLGYLIPAIPNILEHLRLRKAKRQTMTEEEKKEMKKKSNLFKNSNMGPLVLIIVPTRELAQQVESSCKPLRSKFNIHSVAIYGGVEAQQQKEILSQEHNEIVIATPGRLVDLIQRSEDIVGLLGGVGMLVFDEADRMLQLGFGDQLQKISEQIRPDRQTLMFSATFPHAMQEAAKKWLNNPLKIRVKSSSANQESSAIVSKNVKQVVKPIVDLDRPQYLTNFLKSIMDKELNLRNRSLILVFVNTIKQAMPVLNIIDKLCVSYTGRKYKCSCIHGDMKQIERDAVINDFKSGKLTIIVATDILGRGIHINNLRFVINYDFPTSLEQYIHRVGRTGRQGNKGHALTLFTETVQNVPMARGLIKILEECKQQVSPDLKKISDNFMGEVSNDDFDSIKKLLKQDEEEEEEDKEESFDSDLEGSYFDSDESGDDQDAMNSDESG
ncbi:hypothetical protein DICPUDRAFT_149527 [Dictyostelium purpureum]|uniref:RNA helicase n=1 Tax=Dictyostelium purpureum TaxID=5786 RepID=F0ZDZ5_DICPU|nr:uncharacterized protein DICPUDRAFT_149527 [Dictyostelium purpureum]EGC37825.1 hypothetical protein DICPUDRAFT_149527 [Dictyostelium purpureum]|eukprot:XP_003285670.1 hypothetical protein DICPUDRAFT_149527 [Dictyostelium purpureum]